MADLPRRQFLAGLGALAAAPTVHRLAVPARAQPAAAPFEWGVASFDPTPTGVLLWARVRSAAAGADVPLRWQLAADDALTDVVAEGDVTATAAADHCVRVEVADLDAGHHWWFAFIAPNGARSPVGRTRTMPASADRLRVAVAACGRYASGGFAAYRALAGRDVDLVVHVGDYIYEDGGGSGARAHDPPRRVSTLDGYRTRYAQHRADPDLQALHAQHPMVAVWDDHEIAGNAWRDGAVSHDDGRDGPWLARLLAASQAHDEWLPGRTGRGEDGRLRAWRAVDLGELAELVVLDTRAWGRDRQPTSAADLRPASGGPARSMLGDDQAAFVAGRLGREERPPWVLLANQVMLHPLRLPVPGDAYATSLRDRGFLVVDGQAVNPDQWDGYPDARDELLGAVGDRGGVVALTGDVHSSWAWEGPAGGDTPTMVELVTPSITSESFASRIPLPTSLVEAGLALVEDDLSHVELASHGYLLVDCTPERVQGEWWYVDPADPASQRFGAARSAPIAPPMHLVEEVVATEDREGSAAPPSSLAPTTGAATPAPPDDDDGPPWLPIGLGAATGATALGAALALRGRRGR